MTLRLLPILALFALFLTACSSEQDYPQDTPDATVQSAVNMVKNGDAERLSDLIYADSPEMRSVLNRFGRLLGRTYDLAQSIKGRFPQEVEQIKAEAVKRAEAGKDSILARLNTSGNGGRGNGPPFDERAMRQLGKEIFADPFGFIERNEARLSTMPITDDLAALLLDDKPVLAPVGLNLKKDGDKWYVMLPTNLPGMSNVLPRTPEQWSIMGSMMTVFERGIEDLASDVDSGAIAGMSQLQDKLGEKLIAPGAFVFIAYGRELDVRSRVDRRVTQFNARLKAWAESREKASGAPVSPALLTAITRLAPRTIEPMVRRGQRWNAEAASDIEFETTLQGWLDEAGLKVALGREVTADRVDTEVARFEAEFAKAQEAKKKAKARASPR